MMESVHPAPPQDERPSGDFDHEAALEACARGERFALRVLYDREARWLLAVIQRIVRDPDLAQDLLQDVFLLIWQKAGSFQRELGSGRGWIYTVARHRALDEARKNRPEVSLGDEFEAVANALPAHDEGDSPHDDEALARCLAELDDPKRQCVVDAYVEGYTHEQIAARLSKPIGTVKSWIRRGLLALKECLS
jgi:RNA polymerase sigma factor (sigma-70 family)